jgi:hypothetical protein
MINKIYKFISSIIKIIIIDRFEENFIKHNKALFKNSQNKDNQILIELNHMQPNHIAISHFSKVLSKIHDAQLVGYRPEIEFNLFTKLKRYILNFKFRKIYQSFAVNKFLDIDVNNYKTSANQLTSKLMLEISSKSDLEDLTIDDIWVGDLIYDQYLALYKVPTVNIKSDQFRKILFEFFIFYYYWKDLLSKKKIKALVISHACYFMGIPARIAISHGIPVYQVNLQAIYYLSKKNFFPYCEFHSYKNDFEKLDITTKNNGMAKAKERLKLIFDGKTNIDQPYIVHSAYAYKKTSTKIIINKNPVKILISSHSFYDSPHGWGKNLFPDFFEWLEFLGELSNYTDYEWYIKTHPETQTLDLKTIDDFVARYKKITLVPNTTSHHQLIEEGINIVLTTYGSIGIEYAAKNITVINASLNNPHISFDFNIHPKSKEELKKIIFNLNSYVNKNRFSEEVYKCYYMKYLHHGFNIFFSNFWDVQMQMGGYNSLFSSKIYDYWINYYTIDIQNKIELNLKKFILSEKYKLIN